MKQTKKINNNSFTFNELKIFFKAKKEEIWRNLENESFTLNSIYNYSDFVDLIINNIADSLNKSSKRLTILATGGYGRKEVAPFSDVDLLLLTADNLTAEDEKFIESFQAQCWNLGLKPGYSVRTLKDCEKTMAEDLHFLTSLLDRRLVWGEKSLFSGFEKLFRRHVQKTPASAFVAAKLAERDARHMKMGDTRYQLEPNVKEGKGALRDIQTLLWLSHLLYGIDTPQGLAEKGVLTPQEAETLRRAHGFFWTARCHLHLAAGRAEDRLSFDLQPVIAARMGYKEAEPNLRAERFMKDYFLMANEVGHLTRILCAALEADALAAGGTAGTKKIALQENIEGFAVRNNRLTVENRAHFKTPSESVRLFRVSQTSGLDIHPDALRLVRDRLPSLKKSLPGDGDASRIFLDILLDSKKAEQTLRRLNEAGILSALIPAFGNIVAHMQYDMYHVFTADEHTLRAVGTMHKLDGGALAETAPLATELFRKIHSRRALYTAMFLHDIAKGTGGKHSEKGAGVTKSLCPRLGLSGEETETAAWLVENHLLMTLTAFKRDLNDPKALSDFVEQVQSPERLKLLTILTTADIMAVGPDRWNNWKSGLLSELYYKAAEIMSGTGERGADEQSVIIQKKARRLVGDKAAALNYLIDYAPPSFWLSFSAETIAGFAATLHKKESTTVIRINPGPEQDFTEVLVHTADKKGLFATLSGAMAASGASIVEARIFTLSNGMALDVFQVQNLHGHVYENAPFLQKTIKSALAGNIDLAAEIAEKQKKQPKKTRFFTVQPRVIIDNDASSGSTLIEVNGKDKPGFLYEITSALTGLGLQISAAKITTFGSRAVDVFYVKDAFGLKILHREKLLAIETRLKALLGAA